MYLIFDVILFAGILSVKVSYFKAPNHIGGPSEQAMLAQEIPNWCLTAPIENF